MGFWMLIGGGLWLGFELFCIAAEEESMTAFCGALLMAGLLGHLIAERCV